MGVNGDKTCNGSGTGIDSEIIEKPGGGLKKKESP
jgi:hypothetical protein